MELVEHHRADAAQLGVAEQPAREHALGDEARRACAAAPRPRSAPGSRRARRPARRSSSATRRAASRAASRRGSSTRISPVDEPASSSARGTRVVLPAPGGASSTSARLSSQRRDDVGQERVDRAAAARRACAAERGHRELLLLRALRSRRSARLRCFFAAFSRDCFDRRLPAAPSWCFCGCSHRHGSVSSLASRLR